MFRIAGEKEVRSHLSISMKQNALVTRCITS